MIKPNLREFSDVAGCEVSEDFKLETAACPMVEDGNIEIVEVSLGAGGALAVWKQGIKRLRSFTVRRICKR